MKPLPTAVSTVLKSAARQPPERRAKAIDESVKWAKHKFPEYFKEDVALEDLQDIGMPTLTNYLKFIKTLKII